jgi:hypothetical protein
VEEYEVLRAELPTASELKPQSEAVCVADSFCDSSAPSQWLCCSVAASKSKSSNIVLFSGCRPVALKPLVIIFPVALPGINYQRVNLLCNALLRTYSANANTLFLLCSGAMNVFSDGWSLCVE